MKCAIPDPLSSPEAESLDISILITEFVFPFTGRGVAGWLPAFSVLLRAWIFRAMRILREGLFRGQIVP